MLKKRILAIKTEVYSRVVGFYRPIESFNRGKKAEYHDRHVHSAKDFEDASKTIVMKPRTEGENVERGKSNSVQTGIG